jgi:signal peptidase I
MNSSTYPTFTMVGPDQKRQWVQLLREIIETMLIAGALFIVVNLATARIRVDGSSMEPSLHDGEFVVINRLAYRWCNPDRGEVIVFHFPLDPQRRFIKRIIGLPGDSIAVHNGQVFVNGSLIQEPYIAAPPNYEGDWIVETGRVFVLGDNRNNSLDSQNWGTLPLDEIIGKAVVIYWPFEDWEMIPHYDLVQAAED